MFDIVIECRDISDDIIAPTKYAYGRVRMYRVRTIDRLGRTHKYVIIYDVKELDPFALGILLSGRCE
jgi:hypothetical protein